MFNQIICTMDKYDEEEAKVGSIIDVKKIQNPIKEYQKVIAIGPMVKNVSIGDIVMINPKRYAKMKHQEGSLKDGIIGDNPVIAYNFNVIHLDYTPYLIITDQDVDFVVEEYEEINDSSNIIVPDTELIV